MTQRRWKSLKDMIHGLVHIGRHRPFDPERGQMWIDESGYDYHAATDPHGYEAHEYGKHPEFVEMSSDRTDVGEANVNSLTNTPNFTEGRKAGGVLQPESVNTFRRNIGDELELPIPDAELVEIRFSMFRGDNLGGDGLLRVSEDDGDTWETSGYNWVRRQFDSGGTNRSDEDYDDGYMEIVTNTDSRSHSASAPFMLAISRPMDGGNRYTQIAWRGMVHRHDDGHRAQVVTGAGSIQETEVNMIDIAHEDPGDTEGNRDVFDGMSGRVVAYSEDL